MIDMLSSADPKSLMDPETRQLLSDMIPIGYYPDYNIRLCHSLLTPSVKDRISSSINIWAILVKSKGYNW
jgi:hypothetical protein